MSRSIDWICLTAEDYSINDGMIHMRCVSVFVMLICWRGWEELVQAGVGREGGCKIYDFSA